MTVNPSSVYSSSWRSSTGICVCTPTLVSVFGSVCALLIYLLYLYIILYLLDDDGGQTVKLRMATRGELFYLLSTSDFLSLISHVCICVWLLFFCGFLIYSFLWKQYRPPPLHPAWALPPSSTLPASETSSGQFSWSEELFFSPASRSSRNLHLQNQLRLVSPSSLTLLRWPQLLFRQNLGLAGFCVCRTCSHTQI